jgi:hypothetical protein
MFDPERDEDHDSRRFLRRVITIAAVTVAACAVLYPSVTGFAAGPDHQIGCVAFSDGWKRDHTESATVVAAAYATLPKMLTPQQLHDPAAVERFREQWRVAQASPEVQRAIASDDWAAGPGACVHESRHRLILSGIGLGVLFAALAGVWMFARYRGREIVIRGRRGSPVPSPASGRSST